jgi:hypothetical protein
MTKKEEKKTPWPYFASELYRQSGRRRSAKLVPTFADRGVSCGQRNASPRPLNLCLLNQEPLLIYSSISSIDLKEGEALLIFERKIFRKLYGPKYEDGEWKIRENRELEELIKGEDIVKWIKGQRISWLGHLERMEEDRMHT